MNDPSPRPAALVEAMARAICWSVYKNRYAMFPEMEWCEGREGWFRDANEALNAAHSAGFVLTPRTELEEAATLDDADLLSHHAQQALDKSDRHYEKALEEVLESHAKLCQAVRTIEALRQRSRG